MNHHSPSKPSSALSSNQWHLGLWGVCIFVLLIWNFFIAYLTVQDLEHRDFSRFYFSALAFLQGQDMYGQSPATFFQWSANYAEQLWNLNPPIFQLFFLPLAYVSLPVAFGLWTTFSFLALFFSIQAIRQELPLTLSSAQIRYIFLGMLGFAGTGAIIHTGQLTFLLLLPFTLSWIYARKGSWKKSGCLLGLLSAIKPFFLIFLPYFFFKRQHRGLGWFVGTFGGMFALGLLVFGFKEHVLWIQALRDVDWSWSWINLSIHGFLSRTLGETPIFSPTFAFPQLILPLYFLCGGIVSLMTYRVILLDNSSLSVDRAFLLLIIASLLISPVGWIYYLFFVIGPLSAMVQGWFVLQRKRGDLNHDQISRTRRWLLWSTLPGYCFPIYFLPLLQPNPIATFFIGSTYFWSTSLLWLAIFIDGRAQANHAHNQLTFSQYLFRDHETLYPQQSASTIAEFKDVST